MNPRFVYDFDEQCPGGRALLGGKGLGLAEMTQLGLPIPHGFTITTAACRATVADRREPAGLTAEIDQHLARLEERTGKRLGDSVRPLLLSVRSGGPISMPGMMETILNLGLNSDLAVAVAERTGNARFAYDAYRRLIQMYGEVVSHIDARAFEALLANIKAELGVELDIELGADDLQRLAASYEDLYRDRTGVPFPADPRTQLTGAIRAVFESWNAPRACVYRHEYGISDQLGTAVNVMEMVFGNLDERSATGVCFSRNPATGARGLYGEFLIDAQGEDVVAGTRTPASIARCRSPSRSRTPSWSVPWASSSSPTPTCRMWSSRSSTIGSTSSRRGARSGPPRQLWPLRSRLSSRV